MAKRRPRLVPKIVFQLAVGATAIPAIALGCKHDDGHMDNPVAAQGYATAPPPADSCGPGSARVPIGESGDGGFACVPMGVAAVAYDRPQPRPDAAAPQDATPPTPPPVKGVAARGYTR